MAKFGMQSVLETTDLNEIMNMASLKYISVGARQAVADERLSVAGGAVPLAEHASHMRLGGIELWEPNNEH